jgi:hypothetical protein
MSVTPSPIGGFAAQFFDNNGVILSGGKIYTYSAGTTTPQATYTSALGVTPHANPIILDSAGRVPGGEIWLTDGLVYKFVIETATSILLGTYDNITGVNSNFVNYTIQEEVITATSGQTVFNLSTINYTPGTNSLSVYIDGVNQYVGDSYLETDSDTVTFTSGVHVGGEVKFTTAVPVTTGAVDSSVVAYDPPFTGSVATTVQTRLAQYVSVKDFGAVGDGVTDDTAALQACANYLASVADSIVVNGLAAKNHPTFYLPSADGYKITSPITIAKNISVVCDGPILVSAAASAIPSGGAWVRIGEETVTANIQGRNCTFILDVRRITLSDWSSAADVGVTVLTAGSELWVRRIDNFAIGVKLTAPYSVVTLGEFRDCQIGLDVTATTIDFTNQQLFLGGEFAVIAGSNNGSARYGVRVTRGAFGGSTIQNSFVFINPSFELGAANAGASECFAFVCTDIHNLQARDIRSEGSGSAVAKLTGDCRWCQFDLLYSYEFATPVAGLVTDQSTYKIGNRGMNSGGDFNFQLANLIFDSGNLADAATFYGGGDWHLRNMESAGNTDPATFFTAASVSSVDYKNRQVTLGSAPTGVRVNTRNSKVISVVVDGPTNKNIILWALVFDTNGNQLIANTDVLQNVPTPTVSPNTGIYGGAYLMTSALDNTLQIATLTFSSNVATAFIGLSGGDVRSMKLYAVKNQADYTSKSAVLAKEQRIATAAPSSGAYIRGQQIVNANTAAAGSPGWVCTTQGQFGTLSAVTANTTSGLRSVTFSDATNLWIGCAITIAGVSGTKIIEALEGAVGFVDSNCDANVAGGAVAYVTPVFKTMAVVAA